MTFDFGNRHRGNLEGRLSLPTRNARVRIAAGSAFASTQGGQHLLWMLVNLLARQYGIVATLEIAVPAVPLQPLTAIFGDAGNLQATLKQTATVIAADQMKIELALPVDEPEYASVECMDIPGSAWAATADGWNVYVSPGRISTALPASTLSIGPYFAASILAGEIFKTIRGYDPSRRRVEPINMSLWNFEMYNKLESVPTGPTKFAAMPFSYLVGAGAVGQALAATFLTSCLGPKRILSIDGDAIDAELTNLNRYCLATPEDRDRNKADLISGYFTRAGVESFFFPKNWAGYIESGGLPSLPSEIRRAEREGRFELIISCVDINPSRHDLQRMWPRLIVGASTLGMSAAAQIYDLNADHECLMCANPLDSDGWTVEGEVARLRQLPDGELEAEASKVGVDLMLLRAHLRDPKCGTLGEAEIRRFKPSTSRNDWSVGFVSVGAGVILAAVLLQHFSEPIAAAEAHAFRFSFETNRVRKSSHRPSSACECQRNGMYNWRALWV